METDNSALPTDAEYMWMWRARLKYNNVSLKGRLTVWYVKAM